MKKGTIALIIGLVAGVALVGAGTLYGVRMLGDGQRVMRWNLLTYAGKRWCQNEGNPQRVAKALEEEGVRRAYEEGRIRFVRLKGRQFAVLGPTSLSEERLTELHGGREESQWEVETTEGLVSAVLVDCSHVGAEFGFSPGAGERFLK